MNHGLKSPDVVEIGRDGTSRAVQPVAQRPSQRSLVEASLLRCPERPDPDARSHWR
jgi:hypothetical protein